MAQGRPCHGCSLLAGQYVAGGLSRWPPIDALLFKVAGPIAQMELPLVCRPKRRGPGTLLPTFDGWISVRGPCHMCEVLADYSLGVNAIKAWPTAGTVVGSATRASMAGAVEVEGVSVCVSAAAVRRAVQITRGFEVPHVV